MMYQIQQATENHIPAIKAIADKCRDSLGFVRKPSLIEAIGRGELLLARDGNDVIGFCRYHTRLDSWTTVHEVATHADYRGRGIACAILDRIPRPLRLKCKTTNDRANKFYQHYGLMNVWTEYPDEPRKPLYIWQSHPDVVFCAGGRDDSTEIAMARGMYYGTNESHTPTKGKAIYMLDVDFFEFWNMDKKTGELLGEPRWERWAGYLEKARCYKPTIAMVPDYISPGYRRALIKMAMQLVEAGVERPMICPKFPGAVAHIPEWCLVAVSVPSDLAGYLPDPSELKGRRVHLLGGSPADQERLMREYLGMGITVTSRDLNPQKAAGFGSFYEAGAMRNRGAGRVSTADAFARSVDVIMSKQRQPLALQLPLL
jgi:ribosomal protein S18 acetylase RimI-like enzyme